MKAKFIYAIAIALILASWAGNYAYNRYSQLPEASFLRHYVETRTVPSVAFDLLYVANNADKRKIVSAQVDELPMLRFYPVQIHQELRHQTIYLLKGYYDENSAETAADPLKLHAIKAIFSDGSMSEEDVGEIIVYREAWPPAQTGESPVQMSSSMGSSNHDGSTTVQLTRPVKLTGVSSAWLEKLGPSFQFEVKSTADPIVPVQGSAAYPLELNRDQALTVKYRFSIPPESPRAMEVYNLLLREKFEEPNGDKYDYTVFANYLPYPTESQMRAYVREQRRLAG